MDGRAKGAMSQQIKSLTAFQVGRLLLVAGVLVVLLHFYPKDWLMGPFIKDFYANASTELISIAFTVLIIDSLYQRRQNEQLKAQLIREMGSGDEGFARRAVAEISARNWLFDGSLKSANLWGAHLEKANLWRAHLGGANLVEANLVEANLGGAELGEAHLEGANLEGANLGGAQLEGANLGNAKLGGAHLEEANLGNANLEGANLEGANLWGANLEGANLGGANLMYTQLEGAKFRAANLDQANLEGARYDQQTVWPDGFNPKDAGADLVD